MRAEAPRAALFGRRKGRGGWGGVGEGGGGERVAGWCAWDLGGGWLGTWGVVKNNEYING